MKISSYQQNQTIPSPYSTEHTLIKEHVASIFSGRLIIPTINVDAVIEPVGVTSLGAMDVPKNILNVGLFSLGPYPGEIGTAVIDGHSGWKNNIPVVFDDLHKLQTGDRVHVEDTKGVMTTFVVRKIQVYNKNDDTLDIFISDDAQAHLNLITCGGVWDKKEKKYPDRLVIFTDKEEDNLSLSSQGENYFQKNN